MQGDEPMLLDPGRRRTAAVQRRPGRSGVTTALDGIATRESASRTARHRAEGGGPTAWRLGTGNASHPDDRGCAHE